MLISQLTEVRSIEVAEEKILCLSLDYVYVLAVGYPAKVTRSTGDALIVSLSSGHLAHVPLGEDEDIQSFSAHMYEPWITSFDKGDESGMTAWSGGDDCVLKKWDLGQTFRPSLVNKQYVQSALTMADLARFEAGVTTITFSPHTPYLMAVGRYV
jgi:diphthamide biosynthesis protein 7